MLSQKQIKLINKNGCTVIRRTQYDIVVIPRLSSARSLKSKYEKFFNNLIPVSQDIEKDVYTVWLNTSDFDYRNCIILAGN